MKKASFILLALLLYVVNLNAKFLYNEYLVSPKASKVIENIGSELKSKCGINGYLITTNSKIERGVSIYDFLKEYKDLRKPFVAIVFAPNSKRIHVVANPKELLKGLDKDKILDYAIKIIASKDGNSLQSKYDVGLVQSFSEMADEVAKSKGVTLNSTIKDSGHWVITILNILIIFGSLIVIWIYFIRPIFKRK